MYCLSNKLHLFFVYITQYVSSPHDNVFIIHTFPSASKERYCSFGRNVRRESYSILRVIFHLLLFFFDVSECTKVWENSLYWLVPSVLLGAMSFIQFADCGKQNRNGIYVYIFVFTLLLKYRTHTHKNFTFSSRVC